MAQPLPAGLGTRRHPGHDRSVQVEGDDALVADGRQGGEERGEVVFGPRREIGVGVAARVAQMDVGKAPPNRAGRAATSSPAAKAWAVSTRTPTPARSMSSTRRRASSASAINCPGLYSTARVRPSRPVRSPTSVRASLVRAQPPSTSSTAASPVSTSAPGQTPSTPAPRSAARRAVSAISATARADSPAEARPPSGHRSAGIENSTASTPRPVSSTSASMDVTAEAESSSSGW